MKKKILKILLLMIVLLLASYTIKTFAIFRKFGSGTGSFNAATWNVTRSQSQSGDSIDISPGSTTDDYILTVQSSSEVDVVYSIIISNLPSGVEVDLDNSGNYRTPSSGTITINQAGTINYNDSVKTKTHTLTFRATSGASTVSNQSINIDVQFKQVI